MNSCYCINEYIINNNNKLIKNIDDNNSNNNNNKLIKNIDDNNSNNNNNKLIKNIDDNNKLIKNIDDNNIEFISDIPDELINKKQEIQHQLNLIKYNENKLKELQQIYEIDLKLFEKFEINIKNDNSFKIPELFYDKYLIFKKLKEENKLCFNNFINNYNSLNNYELFPLNNYELSYLNKELNILDEEFELDINL
jgi:hypothetical protein